MKRLLSLRELDTQAMRSILDATPATKAARGKETNLPLTGQVWAMLFSKSSTRTRVSFEVGIRELGGSPLFLNGSDIQLGRGEPIEDTARVLGRMVHGVIIRTYDQSDLVALSEYSGLPIVNALTDEEHPCQILADIATIEEKRGPIAGKRVAFIGDGDCNVARSWLYAAKKLGFELRVGAPKEFQPADDAMAAVDACPGSGSVIVTDSAQAAVEGADVVYTDVWVSMGREAEAEERLKALAGFQVNGALMAHAAAEALVMHCLPAYRGKEIDHETMEAHTETIFDQAEMRLHAQKSVLDWIVR